MTWFRVDDKFHQHPKVLQIPRSVRAESVGTWTLSGTWCAGAETDGYLASYVVEELGGTIAGAEALVEAKLWRKRPKGYQFVNWSQFQFTREQNDARREAERVRKAEQRAARKAKEDGASSENVPVGQKRVPNTPSPSPSPDPNPRLLSSSGQGDDEIQHGEVAVDNARVLEHLHAMTGRPVEKIDAWRVTGLVLQRNPNPKRPTAYVLASITRDPIGWQNYLDTGTEPE